MLIKCRDGNFILNEEQVKTIQEFSKQFEQLSIYEYDELELSISKQSLQYCFYDFSLTELSYEELCSLANDYDYLDMENHLESVSKELLRRLKSYPLAKRVALLQ